MSPPRNRFRYLRTLASFAGERAGNNLKWFEKVSRWKWLKPRPECGLDSLICFEIAEQRHALRLRPFEKFVAQEPFVRKNRSQASLGFRRDWRTQHTPAFQCWQQPFVFSHRDCDYLCPLPSEEGPTSKVVRTLV